MKKVVLSLTVSIVFSTLFLSCAKEETLEVIPAVSVSQGTYMGVVHLNWSPTEGAEHYNIERLGPNGGWIQAGYISSPPCDDYGLGLPDNHISFGTHYSYRIQSYGSDVDASPFTYVAEQGWTSEIEPIELSVTKEENTINLFWVEPNVDVENLSCVVYELQRKREFESNYSTFHTTDHLNPKDNYSYSIHYATSEDESASYKIKARYCYRFKDMDNYSEGQCNNESNESGVSNGGSTTSFTWNNLCEFGNSNNGISFAKTKVYDNTIYTAIIDNPAIGSPIIYQLNGNNFENISNSYPIAFENNFTDIDFTVKSGIKYIAGISDSAYVFSYDGNWSVNLASENFGYPNKPQALALETDGQDVFAAIYTDDNNLVIKKWNHDAIWDDIELISNQQGISNIKMTQINGTVYLYYLKQNSGYNSTLFIKHFNGSSWVDDLEWTRDNIMDVKLIVDGSANLYFISDSQQPSTWSGGVFKVISLSNAENLLSENENWLTFPSDITVNTNGDIMLAYVHIVSSSQLYPSLAIYKNNTWSKVSGDYTNGTFPAQINTLNQDYIFIYGDANNITGNGYPLKLKTDKLIEN